jgi:hypothetical protein
MSDDFEELPVTCSRCQRTTSKAYPEEDNWVKLGVSTAGIVYACPVCATEAERKAAANPYREAWAAQPRLEDIEKGDGEKES